MLHRYPPPRLRQLLPCCLPHRKVIGRPVFRVPFLRDRPTYANEPTAPKMHDPPLRRNVRLTDGDISFPIGVDQPVAGQPRQATPAAGGNELTVFPRGIPAVHPDLCWSNAPFAGVLKHLPTLFGVRLPALRRVINPNVTRDQGVPFRPAQGQPGHPLDDPLMLAAPVVGEQLHRLGVGWIQGGVIKDHKPPVQIHAFLRLLPQRLRVGRLSWKQAGEGIVGWDFFPFGLTPGGFGAGEHPLGGDEQVDIIQVVTPGWVQGNHLLLTGVLCALS